MDRNIIKIDMDPLLCLKSCPCQHRCTLTYNNGDVENKLMSSGTLVSDMYYNFLSDDAKNHVGKYLNWSIPGEKNKNYSNNYISDCILI